jgi:hypothetical protein
MTGVRKDDFMSLLPKLPPSVQSHTDYATWVVKGVGLCSLPCETAAESTTTVDTFNAFHHKWQSTLLPKSDWYEWIVQYYVFWAENGSAASAPAPAPAPALAPAVNSAINYSLLPSFEFFKFKKSNGAKNSFKYVLTEERAKQWYYGPASKLFNSLKHDERTFNLFVTLFKALQKLNCTYGIKSGTLEKSEQLVAKLTKVFEEELINWFSTVAKLIKEHKSIQEEQQNKKLEVFKEIFLKFKEQVFEALQLLISHRKNQQFFNQDDDESEGVVSPEKVKAALSERPPKRACSPRAPLERLRKRQKHDNDNIESDIFASD